MTGRVPKCGTAMLLVAIALAVVGCSSYSIRARVVEAARNSITIEPLDAAPPGGTGIEGVTITIHRDPSQLNRTVAGEGVTNASGEAVIKVDGFGTGWMAEEWLVEAVGPHFERADALLGLPANPSDDVIIIRLVPGVAVPKGYESDYDPMDDYERFR